MLKTISLAVYQYDNDNKSCTTGDNMHQVASEGYWQSHPPLGMKAKHIPSGKRDKEGRMRYRTVLEPDETNDVARKVTDLLHYAAEGHRPAEAVRFAEKIGLRTKNGNQFTPQSMKNLLENAALAGYICSPTLTDGEYYKANWEGLISLEEHLVIQRVLYGNKEPDEKQPYCRDNPDFPLKGTLICAKCGYNARGSYPRNGSGNPSPRYHCSECTGAGSIMPEAMHEKFTGLLDSLTPMNSLLRAFKVSLVRAMHHSVEKAESAIAEKKARLKEIEAENDESFALVMRHKRSQADHERFIKILEKEKAELEESLIETEDYKSLSEAKIERLVSLMENPAEIWKKAPLEVRRMLQEMIFPFGIKANLGTGEFEKVGTHNLSPLYSVIPPKNGSNEPSNSPLVPGTGLEPAQYHYH
ncbi:recombinase family protein [Candidatus Saccharibacteria bacterium]|nr:recombinase family protein [Candidatus Saccharibacteria bacterium]